MAEATYFVCYGLMEVGPESWGLGAMVLRPLVAQRRPDALHAWRWLPRIRTLRCLRPEHLTQGVCG